MDGDVDRGIGGAAPCAWETQVVADMRSTAHKVASSYVYRNRGGLPVEDVTQLLLIAVVRACRVWARTSADRPPRPYLNVSMSNALLCMADRRRVRRHVDVPWGSTPNCRPLHGGGSGLGVADDGRRAEDRVPSRRANAEDRLAARSVLALLERSGVDMEALTIWAEGLSADEAAERLGVAPGTFRNRVCRARKEARGVLGASWQRTP